MSTIKISELGNLTTVLGNTIVPVVGNVAGTLTTLRSNVAQLQTFILGTVVTDLANLTASTTANAAVQSGAITAVDAAWQANAATQLSQITAANAAIVTANTALKGYVDAANTIQSNEITTISNSVTSANTNMKGYVDAANTIQSNEITTISNSVTGANAAIVTANTAMKGYVDAANTVQSNEITAISNSVTGANAAIVTANTAMKGYVDANNATQLTSINNITNGTATFGNIIPSANVTYNLGSPTAQWKDLYLSGSTIYIGGGNISVANNTFTTSLPFTATGTISAVDLAITNSIICGTIFADQSELTGYTTLYQTGFDSNMANLAYGTVALSVTTNGDPRADQGALLFEGNNPDGIGIVPSNDTAYTLGSASHRWGTIYSQTVETESVIFSNGGIFSTIDGSGLPYIILASDATNATAIATPSSNVSILNYISINETYANVVVHNANTAVTHTWQFTQDGDIKLPAAGDILDSAGNSVITSFTMGNAAHWTTPVTTIAAALDQIAERLWDIENPV
jgi:hypothetical protein